MALQDITTIPLKERNRETGIPAVGAAPWGTHLCSFYDTKQDLIDILVPYFKAGLKSNEFCIWVTSEPLNENEAEEALRNAVPDFAQYLERGQIEIVPYDEWYLKDGVFNQQRVLKGWIDKLNQALATGYDGMRLTGNTSWLEKRNWRAFTDYEEEVDNVIGKYHMLAICTYSLGSCGASEAIDVMSHHQSALTRQAGDWVLIESSERKWVKHDLNEREKELKCLYGITDIAEKPGITLDELYQEVVNLLPSSWQYPEITCARIAINGKKFKTENYRETEWQQSADIMAHGAKVGAVEVNYLEARTEIDEGPFLKEERLLIDAVAERLGDIAEHKRAEEQIQLQSEVVRNMTEGVLLTRSSDRKIIFANPRFEEMFGYGPGELIGKDVNILNAPGERTSEEVAKEIIKQLDENGVWYGEVNNIKKDGTCFWCRASISEFEHPVYGKVDVNVLEDITERKRAEEEIKKFKLIADIADYGVAIRDPERIIVYVNESYARMHGYTTDELIGKHTSIVYSEEETKHVKRLINKQLRLGGFTNEEVWHKKKDGTVFPTLTTVTILRDGEGKLLFASGIVIDITERKRAEEELLLSREQLRNLSEYLQYVKEERKEPLTTLQEKFIKSGFAGFKDQEVVELLLSLVLSPPESKRLAKKCIEEFQSLRGFLSASPQQLHEAGLTPECMFYIKLLREIPAEVLREKIIERSVYNSSQEIFDYLSYSMRDLKKEVFKVIYLNKRDQIIDIADLFEGTFDVIPIRPREIVDSAIKHNASFLIFVHNHTSGDPSPSKTDKRFTRDLVFVGNVLQIRVLDHIIIGENRYFSFADDGLIQKYEDDFLNIRIRRI